MAATILFDQIGLPAGISGRARSDGLDTGATVTITNASGQPCRCEFWWIPPDDTVAALSQNSAIQWEFDPEAARYGEYIVRMIEAEGTASETEDIKSFGVRLPSSGLLITGFNSKGDFDVNLASSGADKVQAALIAFQNEPLPDNGLIDYVNWWQSQRELYQLIESLALGTGVTSLVATAQGLVSSTTITPTVSATGDVIIDLPGISLDATSMIMGDDTPPVGDLGIGVTAVGARVLTGFDGDVSNNTIIGRTALINLQSSLPLGSSTRNIIIGDSVMSFMSSFSLTGNVAIGYKVGSSMGSDVFDSVFIGNQVAGNGGNIVGAGNVYIGANACRAIGSSDSKHSVCIGRNVCNNEEHVEDSIIFGYLAGAATAGSRPLGIEDSFIAGDESGNTAGDIFTSVMIGSRAGSSGFSSVDRIDSVLIGNDAGFGGFAISNCVFIGAGVGDTHSTTHTDSIMISANASTWTSGTGGIMIGTTADTPIATISNYLNVGTVLTGDIATQKGAIGAGNSIDITPQLAKFGAYTTSELVAASAVHSTDGTHPAISKTFVTDRDPNTVITGSPGDLCIVSDGVSSTIFQHIGVSASNSDWSALGGGGASTFVGLSDTPGSITANQFLVGNAGGTALEFVSNLNLQDANISNLNTVSFNSTHDNGNVSGAVGIDFATNGQKQEMTLTGDVTALTFTFPSGVASGFVLMISQDGTGGRTIVFGAGASKQARGGDLLLSDGSSTVTAMFIHWDGSVATITTIPDLQTSPTITNI